jgi:hypothetical protein
MKHGFKNETLEAPAHTPAREIHSRVRAMHFERASDNPPGGVAVQRPVRMFLIDSQHFPIRVPSVLIRG